MSLGNCRIQSVTKKESVNYELGRNQHTNNA